MIFLRGVQALKINTYGLYCVSFISNGFNRFLITLTPVFYKGYLQAPTLFEGRKFIDGSKYFEGLRVDSTEPLW